jgi:hypothetical protein
MRPLGRNGGLGKNCLNRTLRHTGIAINACFGIDDKHVIVEVEGFDRTNEGTVRIPTIHAWFCYHISHECFVSRGGYVVAVGLGIADLATSYELRKLYNHERRRF